MGRERDGEMERCNCISRCAPAVKGWIQLSLVHVRPSLSIVLVYICLCRRIVSNDCITYFRSIEKIDQWRVHILLVVVLFIKLLPLLYSLVTLCVCRVFVITIYFVRQRVFVKQWTRLCNIIGLESRKRRTVMTSIIITNHITALMENILL